MMKGQEVSPGKNAEGNLSGSTTLQTPRFLRWGNFRAAGGIFRGNLFPGKNAVGELIGTK